MDMKIFEERESEIRGYCRAYPTVFNTAKGSWQTDEQGKDYLDFFAGAGVLNFGHNHESLIKAVTNYLQSGGVVHSLDMYSVAKREFIQAFVKTILEPRKMDHKLQFMGPTGTNAVEAALKLARRVTGRKTVYSFGHGFHGMTLGALSCTANSYFREAAGVELDNVHRVILDKDRQLKGEELLELKNLRKNLQDSSSGLEKPAAFIVEVIQAEGGVYEASQAWLKELQDIAHEHGALLIIDDIQAGIGRTGSYFSFDEMGLDPDIITLAKGAGGLGTPIAFNLVKPEHDKHWSAGEHTGTFRGQNISFVAGTEALKFFDDDKLMNEVKEKGKYLKDQLLEIAQEHKDKNLSVRGRGMIVGIDLNDGKLSKKVQKECFEKGLLIGPCGTGGRVIKLIPPLTTEQKDLESGMKILKEAINSVLKGV